MPVPLPAQPPLEQTYLCADNQTIYAIGAGKYSAIWLPLRMRGNDVAECCQARRRR